MGLLLAMGGAVVVTRSIDKDQCLGNAVDGSMFDPVVDAGDTFGNGLTAGAAALGFYAAGELFDNQRLSAAGGDLTKSLLVTWGSVWTLKLLVDADRPTGGDHAFPSGHTATSFAVAPVLTKHFGWKVGIPAYTLATATAFARLEERKHCIADVLVGAALGLVIGSEVTSKGGLRTVREHVTVHGRGLGVKVRF
jgi:membrane-associated phospholipid phosphatase